MKTIPTDAFDFYFSLGPGLSYQAVADRYDCSKRAVTSKAKREDWQQRLLSIEAKARDSSDTTCSRLANFTAIEGFCATCRRCGRVNPGALRRYR